MDSWTIRRAVGRDAVGLTEIMQTSKAYRGEYASIIHGYRVRADYVARHQVYVAQGRNGRLLGFYALVLKPPELDLAFVADDAQGLGIGRSLIEHMIGRARRLGLSEVRVVAHPPAKNFYRRLGAEPIGMVSPSPPKVTWERPELRFALE